MATTTPAGAIGTAHTRIEARDKVTGAARYAYEHPVEGVAYCVPVQSTIAAGAVRSVDAAAALALQGTLAVVSFENAPRLAEVDDPELAVLQSAAVTYRGQIVGAVIAEGFEIAREAAALVAIDYDAREHDVVLRPDHPGAYAPEKVNAGYPTEVVIGDPDAALAAAPVSIDVAYTTPAFHNNPMEPHATLAVWEGGDLTLYDSNQGAPNHRATLAQVFDLPPERVRVISPHVGGGFGSKGTPRPSAVLAALAAKVVDRPVKLAVSRQQMFAFTGYRTPTIQRVRLGAERDGTMTAVVHEALHQSSTLREFTEQTATATRVMWAAPHRRTGHTLARLDVPTPSWMRAPGETPGMYALESAMDELAVAAGIDPIELRIRNEPPVHPENGKPFSSRNVVACLREGANRFGWSDRDPTPRARRAGGRAFGWADRDPHPGLRPESRWLVGTGVACSMYPAYRSPSGATARAESDGRYVVRVGAADIGTGARTVLTQIAADALGVAPDAVTAEIGDSDYPRGPVAGGSMGTASWGSAVVRACEALRAQLEERGGDLPPDGLEASVDTRAEIKAQADLARNAFGAQFVEVHVDVDTGETRVTRMLGVFAVGRIINPLTARSQLIGGMTMGISMALHEASVMDAEFGDYLNHDFAQYHVAACADVLDVDATWVDERDDELNPMGSKGIGEIGIVGAAAAVGNAVHHATGVRVRDLPIRPEKLL